MSGRGFAIVVALMVAAGIGVGWFLDPSKALSAVAAATRGLAHSSAQASDKDEAPGFKGPRFQYTIDTRTGKPDHAEDGILFGNLAHRPGSKPCSMPTASDDETLVMFGAYEGAAMSPVSVGGMDTETRLIDVNIEPGDKPLYLVLSSYRAVIWRFTGATARVRKLALLSYAKGPDKTPAVGAVGADQAVIGVAALQDCFEEFNNPQSQRAKLASDAVDHYANRRPDVVAGLYSTAVVRLPSGMAADISGYRAKRPAGFDALTWQEAVRFTPLGVASLDAGLVQGPARAQAYDILPSQMGIAQLVGAGRLTHANNGYRIVQPIDHYPAGLYGAQAAKFILAKDIPTPGGSPGHSCVVDEQSGRKSDSVLC